jgi:hypothetical protein
VPHPASAGGAKVGNTVAALVVLWRAMAIATTIKAIITFTTPQNFRSGPNGGGTKKKARVVSANRKAALFLARTCGRKLRSQATRSARYVWRAIRALSADFMIMQRQIDEISLHVGPRALAVVLMIPSRTVILARDREIKEGRKVKWQHLLLESSIRRNRLSRVRHRGST